MYRRTTVDDPTLTHLWRDDHTTECGLIGDQLALQAQATCVSCLDAYGRDIAEAFGHLTWLGVENAPTVHVFNSPDVDGRRTTLCGLYNVRENRLATRQYRMRCPHCIRSLRFGRTPS